MDSYSETKSRLRRTRPRPRATLAKTMRALSAAACAGAALILAAQAVAAAGLPASAAPAGVNARASAAARPVAEAAADRTAPASASAASVQTLDAQVIRQLKARMPAGARIDAIDLGCTPPAGAALKSVAPGVSVLESRGFLVELVVKGRTIDCSATVEAKRQVLAATHDIAPREPVSQADFAGIWVEAFSGAPGALASFPAHGPYVSATSFRAGMPLYRTQLARPLAIHPGDMVTVLVRNGPVLVRTRLEARQAASIGETAALVNPNGGAIVNATVTGVRTAEMVLQ